VVLLTCHDDAFYLKKKSRHLWPRSSDNFVTPNVKLTIFYWNTNIAVRSFCVLLTYLFINLTTYLITFLITYVFTDSLAH